MWATSTANASVVRNETVYFTVDTTNPQVSWSPYATPSGTQSSVSIIINCTFSDLTTDTIGYQFKGVNYTTWDGNDGASYWVRKRNLEFGQYNDIYCWINDSVGHYNESSHRSVKLVWTDWWDDDWSLRKPISFIEVADKYDLVNYTHILSVNTSKLYSENKIRSDCGDIRFIYNDTHKEIYYNFSECNITGGNTTFWLMFNLSKNSTMLMHMYYNNSHAATTKENLHPYSRDGCMMYDPLDMSTTGTITGTENTDYEWVTDGRGRGMLHELSSSFTDDWSTTPGSAGTIEFWLKLDQEMNTSDLVSQKPIIKSGRNMISFDVASGNNYAGSIVFLITPQSGLNSEINTTRKKWNKDEFCHIAVTWDGSTQKIYVNGTVDVSATQSVAGGWGTVYTNKNTNWGGMKYKISDLRVCPIAKTIFPYVVYPEPNSTIETEETVPFLEMGSPTNSTYFSRLVDIYGETSEYANITWSINGNANQTACYNCTTFSNTTQDNVNEGLNNITIYAISTESSKTEIRTIWFSVAELYINLESPLNHSGDSDGNITFYYNLTGQRLVSNCSLLLNGKVNQTNTTDQVKNTRLNFTANNLSIGSYNWTVSCTASDGTVIDGNVSYVDVIFANEFGGSSTDLSAVDIRSISAFTIENSSSGKIIYSEIINLSGGVDLNSIINISINNITVDTVSEPRLNKSATITLYNLTYAATPAILRSGALCPQTDCHPISYNSSNGTFVFTVNHFTSYSATNNSQVWIWDDTDSEGGNKTIYAGEPITLYANYTNRTDGSPINGSGVYCNVTTDSNEYEMSYNATSRLYEYTHTYYTAGNQSYTINCNGTSAGYEPTSATDNATINMTYLEVNLITPPTIPGDGSANYSNGYIVGINRTFTLNATVTCREGYCGYVNATVRYNKSSSDPDANIPTTYTPGEAFFMQNGVNTKNCSSNPLDKDEWCNITWVINTSADLYTLWKIDVMFNSSLNRTNTTNNTAIEVGKILLFDLSFDVIDFGVINPDGDYILYPAINSSNMTYNITVDPNSNDIEELWIKGTKLTNGTLDYNRYINASNVKWARSYLGDNPVNDPNLYNLTESYEKVNKDNIPIYSGTNETMYYWIDAPGGILPLTYTGTLTIMGNATY
ncbi:MAG: DUF2341 domain-containing protein [Candidatus Micrarchaeota archaeon]|nr:DUF2341 domain-containing protein [Candidatus Micrarchaeota archaeon]